MRVPRALDAPALLAPALALAAVIVFAAITPLLPSNDLKVDATVLAAVAGAFAVYIRARRGEGLLRTALDRPAAAFLFVAVLATIFSVNRFASFFPSKSRGEGLVTYIAYIMLALMTARLTRRQATVALAALLAAGSLMGAVALLQFYGINPNEWIGLGPISMVKFYNLGGVIRAEPYSLGGRSDGTLGNPVFLGGYASLLLPIAVALAVHLRSRAWWASAAASTLLYGALVGSQTRAAWVASLGGGILFLWLLPKSRQVYRRLVLLVILFAALTVVMQMSRGALLARASTVSLEANSLQVRFYLWRHTLPLIWQRPVLGWGFSTLLGRFPDQGSAEYFQRFGFAVTAVDTPHNETLHIAYSTGLVGLAAYLWVWGTVMISLRRALRGTAAPHLAGAWIAGLAAYFLWLQLAWSHIGAANVFWAFAGGAAALARWDGER